MDTEFASAVLPTKRGKARIEAFSFENKDHAALVFGNVFEKEDLLVRIHSECLTGDVFGSLRCDCGDQLQKAMSCIADAEQGVIIYLRQEGRGIGFLNKIRAYSLQDNGNDTVQANICLGFKPDHRSYSAAVHFLHKNKIKSVKLLTNNPQKISELTSNGIRVERIPLLPKNRKESKEYLQAKKEILGQLL